MIGLTDFEIKIIFTLLIFWNIALTHFIIKLQNKTHKVKKK